MPSKAGWSPLSCWFFFTPASHSDREKLKDCRSSAIKAVQACYWSILALWAILGSLSAVPRSRAFAAMVVSVGACACSLQWENPIRTPCAASPSHRCAEPSTQVDPTRPVLGGAVAKSWARDPAVRVSTASTTLAALFHILSKGWQQPARRPVTCLVFTNT